MGGREEHTLRLLWIPLHKMELAGTCNILRGGIRDMLLFFNSKLPNLFFKHSDFLSLLLESVVFIM